jgi:hypothetical protein
MRYWILFLISFKLFSAEYTNIQHTGGSKNRFDLVFIGDRYFENEMDKYFEDVNYIWEALPRHYAFWNRYKNFFNVHRIDMISRLNRPEDINDPSNSAFGIDFNLGYWDGWNDWQKCLRIAAEFGIENETTCILTNRIFNVGTALDRSSTKLIYSAPWASIVAHEIGHILGMAGDEYSGEIQEYMFDYAFNMARSDAEARQRWGHWIGYKDPISGYEINQPYMRGGTNYFVPTKSNGLMHNSSTGDFHAVNREQMVLELYKRVSPIDSHTENNKTIKPNIILELNVVDKDVISTAWIINNKIISTAESLDLSELDIDENTTVYGCAWDNALNLDYLSNDRGGWVRKDERGLLSQIVSWKISSISSNHLEGDNDHLLPLLLHNTFNDNFFNSDEVITFRGGDEKKYNWTELREEKTENENIVQQETVQTQPASYGWVDGGFFGIFYPLDNGWIYHIEHEWMYLAADWMWIESKLDWFWTREDCYPYFYSNNLKTWILL